MRRIIRFDINIVENEADFIIVHWSEGTAKGAGTHAELTSAMLHGKPVFCVTDCEMPAWAMACCSEIFDTWSELYAFLGEEFGE